VESKGQVVKTHLFVSDAEQPADIAIRVREEGWKPFRVRFDNSNLAWVVSFEPIGYHWREIRSLSAISFLVTGCITYCVVYFKESAIVSASEQPTAQEATVNISNR